METVAVEGMLHDTGAISIISSDSQAMGRVRGVISRTWRTVIKMKEFRGPLVELGDGDGVDNGRVKRHIAKFTVNQCVLTLALKFIKVNPLTIDTGGAGLSHMV